MTPHNKKATDKQLLETVKKLDTATTRLISEELELGTRQTRTRLKQLEKNDKLESEQPVNALIWKLSFSSA